MIGLLTLQSALPAGAGRVFVIDLDDFRPELARNLDATGTFNAKDRDRASEIRALTSGRGADIALESVGTSSTVKLALDAVRKAATVTPVGNVAPKVEIGLQFAVTGQIRFLGSCASSGEYPPFISLISREAIRIDPLLSAVAPLDQGAECSAVFMRANPGC